VTVNSCLQGQLPNDLIRYGDIQNKISIGTAAVYATSKLVQEHVPYYKEYSEQGDLAVIPTYHFIAEFRRQWSGDIVEGTSDFSPTEELFYNDFIEWVNGCNKSGDTLAAILALDVWLTDEVSQLPHGTTNRKYEEWNPWMKLIAEDATC